MICKNSNLNLEFLFNYFYNCELLRFYDHTNSKAKRYAKYFVSVRIFLGRRQQTKGIKATNASKFNTNHLQSHESSLKRLQNQLNNIGCRFFPFASIPIMCSSSQKLVCPCAEVCVCVFVCSLRNFSRQLWRMRGQQCDRKTTKTTTPGAQSLCDMC